MPFLSSNCRQCKELARLFARTSRHQRSTRSRSAPLRDAAQDHSVACIKVQHRPLQAGEVLHHPMQASQLRRHHNLCLLVSRRGLKEPREKWMSTRTTMSPVMKTRKAHLLLLQAAATPLLQLAQTTAAASSQRQRRLRARLRCRSYERMGV